MKIFVKDKNQIAFFGKKADSEFWDELWETNDLANSIRSCTYEGIFLPVVEKWLNKGAKVLDGGCGNGFIVHALQHNGYEAVGVDFAKNTIDKVKEAVPELNLIYADIREMPVDDHSLDGYISGGVIEHFWDGYDSILKEMQRVIKKDGFLFITFPYMSPLRKLKAFLKIYPSGNTDSLDSKQDTFYQFALEANNTIKDIESHGFKLLDKKPLGGLKGFKDEVPLFRSRMQKMYDDDVQSRFRFLFKRFLTTFSGHVILCVFQNVGD